jgi:hypothetical protein
MGSTGAGGNAAGSVAGTGTTLNGGNGGQELAEAVMETMEMFMAAAEAGL